MLLFCGCAVKEVQRRELFIMQPHPCTVLMLPPTVHYLRTVNGVHYSFKVNLWKSVATGTGPHNLGIVCNEVRIDHNPLQRCLHQQRPVELILDTKQWNVQDFFKAKLFLSLCIQWIYKPHPDFLNLFYFAQLAKHLRNEWFKTHFNHSSGI